MLHDVILILDAWPDLIARLLCSIFWGLATRDNLEYTRNFTCLQVVSRLDQQLPTCKMQSWTRADADALHCCLLVEIWNS